MDFTGVISPLQSLFSAKKEKPKNLFITAHYQQYYSGLSTETY